MILGLFRSPAPVVAEATARDAPGLAAIHATGFERGWDAIEFERLIAERGSVCHLAKPGGRGVATGFALSRIVGDEAEILTVAVLPKARGAGLAKTILRLHLARLAARGARAVFLEVAEDNAAALRLYRSLGFAEIGRRAGYYSRRGAAPATAIVMRRPLG
jgi:ribosomal-protein-alanine N-acetyltransferase